MSSQLERVFAGSYSLAATAASVCGTEAESGIEVRSLRSLAGSLTSVFLTTAGFSAGFSILVCAALGRPEPGVTDFDPVLFSCYGLNFGQMAALTFGAIAMAAEYKNAGIRVSLAAVPNRGLFYAARPAALRRLRLTDSQMSVPAGLLSA